MFKSYLHCVANNTRVHETIGAKTWGYFKKRLLFLKRQAWELAIGGSRLASL